MNVNDFPSRILLGITGHRDIDQPEAIRSAIHDQITAVRQRVSGDRDQDPIPSLLSALAEGTDRLAADATLDHDSGELHAVLPLQPDNYKQTFTSTEAKRELDTYLNRALTTTVQPDRGSTPGAYLDVGKAIVDTCDVLLAVWDGNTASGAGGTGDIVRYARRHQKPLVWINPADPQEPLYENFDELGIPHTADIAEFNDQGTDKELIQDYCEDQIVSFTSTENFNTEELGDVDQVHAQFEKLFKTHCPIHQKANRVSLKNQQLFKKATLLVYSLAAFAVGVISVQTLFFPQRPEIVLLESLAMVGILSIVFLGGQNKWHENWLKYRTLSEKIRSRLFVGLTTYCTTEYTGPSPVQAQGITSRWVTDILLETWKRTPQNTETMDVDIETMESFLKTHWIDKQIDYHRLNRDESQRKNKILSISGQAVFLVTLIASIIHAIELTGHSYTSYVLLISFFLPSVGGAVGAVRMSRDFETEALRSERILQQLKGLRYQLDYIEAPQDLVEWAHDVEKILEIEHHNWRNIHEGKPLEPAA